MSQNKLGWHPAWSMSERQWMLYEEKLVGSEVPLFMTPPPPCLSSQVRKKVAIKKTRRAAPIKRRAAKATSGDRFVPISNLRPVRAHTPIQSGHVPKGASILIIKKQWLELILAGQKTLEIRGMKSLKRKRIYLAASGGGGFVLGSVEMVDCLLIESAQDWLDKSSAHCVAGDKLPYPATFGYVLMSPPRRAAVPLCPRPLCPAPSAPALEIVDCLLIESVQDWRDKSSAHCVAGDKLPYRSTFGYVLMNPIRFAESIKYEQKGGCVTWACA